MRITIFYGDPDRQFVWRGVTWVYYVFGPLNVVFERNSIGGL